MDNDLSASSPRLSIHGSTQATATLSTGLVTLSVKLPAIKFESSAGNVKNWSRFWEQFRSFIDEDVSLSNINKHVFLQGYLEVEPKMLVSGIAMTANKYEVTKKILLAKYGDTNHIIQAHLDILESLHTSGKICHARQVEHTFIECHRRFELWGKMRRVTVVC